MEAGAEVSLGMLVLAHLVSPLYGLRNLAHK
jgi:hypothetical protein